MAGRPQAVPFTTGWLIALLLALCATAAIAQPADDPDAILEAARQRVDSIEKRLQGDSTDAELVAMRDALLEVQQGAEQIAQTQAPDLARAQARLTELGAAPDGTREDSDVATQRGSLQKTTEALNARIKLARLLSVESLQLADQAAKQRRSRFQAHLFERTDALLSTSFWHDLRDLFSSDDAPHSPWQGQLAAAFARMSAAAWLAWFGIALIGIALRIALGRVVTRLAATHSPAARVRRTLYALAQTLLWMLVPGAVAWGLVLGLNWHHPTPEPLHGLLASFVGAVLFSSYLAGLGRALLSADQPAWRLVPMPDALASALRWQPAVIGSVTLTGWLLQRLAALAQADLAAEVAINCVYALVLALVVGRSLRQGERLRRAALAAAAAAGPSVDDAAQAIDETPPRPLWVSLMLTGLWLALVASVICIVIGYVALGGFVARQVVWVFVVSLTAYLLTLLVADVFDTWVRSPPVDGQDGSEPDGAMPAQSDAAVSPSHLRNQVAVIAAGGLQLAVLLVALVLILAPFGEGPGDLWQRLGQLDVGVAVGELQVRPTAVLRALLVFGLSMLAVRALKRWLTRSFLPTTRLDAGMRSSATTLFGFVGTVFAIAFGLSAIGLALDKIAWIASALSVGIGFGLQAVVSNFVSGLILLAERPVKVGDWVALGGIEGDIRRINVRATEIQMGDRSTVIVPNSEFITKTVRNVTLASPLGLVQIKLPMPLDTDTERVRDLLLQAFEQHDEVLETPAPKVFLDGFDNGNLVFNATGYVVSPRQSYGVKSALLFTVLANLREAGLPMSKPPAMVLRDVPPAE
jgi:small-conductance mechanosensitive channel